MSERRRAFKDYFDRDAAKALAAQMRGAYSNFDSRAFLRIATRDLSALEMMSRVRQWSAALRETLPQPVPNALSVLRKSLPPVLPTSDAVTDGYLQWPVGQFIADYGTEHFDPSMRTMVALTQRFSSEFAVRPFVALYPKQTFDRLESLTTHKSEHVRRWCSEGVRPRLPWGAKLHELVADPSPIIPILEALKDDSSAYVRRSVANNLNDISKDHPQLVVKVAKRWSKEASKERHALVRHALRTLVKKGNPAALAVMGIGSAKGIEARLRASPSKVTIGRHTDLEVQLHNRTGRARAVLVDYVVYFRTKTGSESRKVFKWKQTSLGPSQSITLMKKHRFRPATIRALFPGRHRIEAQVNGEAIAETAVHLLAE